MAMANQTLIYEAQPSCEPSKQGAVAVPISYPSNMSFVDCFVVLYQRGFRCAVLAAGG